MNKITKTHLWSSRLASWILTLSCATLMSTTVYAQPNDDCANAQLLNEGPGCLKGTTVNATIAPAATPEPSPSCWGTAPSSTVWYYFTISTAGIYTVSTDNGINNLGEDMQLALYKSTSGCTFDPAFLICSEDMQDPDNGNAFAAEISANLAAGTYYVQVDQFGATQGDFCITLTANVRPSNDIVFNAIDITTMVNAISASNPASSTPYIYNAPSDTLTPAIDDGPTLDAIAALTVNYPTPTQVNCNGSAAGRDTYYGIWYKFTASASTPKTYLNVFPSNGANYYVATLLQQTGTIDTVGGVIDGLTYIACSAGDNGLVNNGGGPRDSANTNINGHPRLDISGLNGTYYVLVNQYSRVTVGPTGPGTVAPPSDGIINLVIEAAPVTGTSIDTRTADGCNNAEEIGCATELGNFSTTLAGLTNAGLTGNITTVQNGRNPAPKANEPLEFVFNGGTGTFQENCQGPNFIGAALERFNNNSGVYKFTLNGAVSTDTGIPDTLLSVTVNDTLIVIDTIVVINPLGPITVTIVDTIINILPAAPCGADVRVTLDNITNKGVNGALAEIFIIPEDNCAGSSAAVMGAETTSNWDQCLSISTSAGALPPGTYYIWVDGGDGQVLTYDLSLDINYFVPGTIVGCGIACDASPRSTTIRTIQAPGFMLAAVRPMPVSNSMFVDYKLDKSAPVTVNIYDISGRLVQSHQAGGNTGMNSLELETSSLPEGMYVINLLSDGQSIRSKFTKVANQ